MEDQKPQAESSTLNATSQPQPQQKPVKHPPCDQCRRRKVKCDAGAPCNRCMQSGLRCTRDIIRKRRGPKKGSGSVIARLRTEHDLNALDGAERPVSGLLPLDIRPSGTRESSYSPLSSPLTPSFRRCLWTNLHALWVTSTICASDQSDNATYGCAAFWATRSTPMAIVRECDNASICFSRFDGWLCFGQ